MASGSLALVMLGLAPIILMRTRWCDVSPRVGIILWYGCGILGWCSVLTFGAALMTLPMAGSLFRNVSSVFMGLVSGRQVEDLGLFEAVGLTIVFDVLTMVLGGWTVGCLNLKRRQMRHCEMLDLLSDFDDTLGAAVIDHPRPLAYYAAGRGGRVVLSRGTFGVVPQQELRAILEHERGHQTGRHDLWALPLASASAFLTFIPYSRLAPQAIRCLLEMAADDVAMRSVGRTVLLSALKSAKVFDTPASGALAWDGQVIERRISRLEDAEVGAAALLYAHTALLLAYGTLAWIWLSN